MGKHSIINLINKTDATCTFSLVRPLLSRFPPLRRHTRCCYISASSFNSCISTLGIAALLSYSKKLLIIFPKCSSSNWGTNLWSWGRTTVAILRKSSRLSNGPASALIDPHRTPLSHSTFPSTRRRTSNGRSSRGRDYDALAGLAVEREIRGLKELCSDRGHFAYRWQTVNQGTVPNH